jgi:hypothetical protein
LELYGSRVDVLRAILEAEPGRDGGISIGSVTGPQLLAVIREREGAL